MILLLQQLRVEFTERTGLACAYSTHKTEERLATALTTSRYAFYELRLLGRIEVDHLMPHGYLGIINYAGLVSRPMKRLVAEALIIVRGIDSQVFKDVIKKTSRDL